MLSSFTGFIEIGIIIFLIKQNFNINQVLIAVLCYQIGCFFSTNIQFRKKTVTALCFFCMGLYALIIMIKFSLFIFLIAFAQTSISLQSIRDSQKTTVSTGAKRIFRVIGFATAPFFNIPALFVIMVATTSILLLDPNANNQNKFNFRPIGYNEFIMIFHQIHYFTYAYFIVIVFLIDFKMNDFFTVLIFVLGWISYLAVPYLLRGRKYKMYFILGHLHLTIILISMFLSNSQIFLAVLWILTGIGGGTVFCIEKILSENKKLDKTGLKLAENIGHVGGLFIGIIVYNLHSTTKAPILYSSLFALIALIMMLFFQKVNNSSILNQ
jgi:hypothetical protein